MNLQPLRQNFQQLLHHKGQPHQHGLDNKVPRHPQRYGTTQFQVGHLPLAHLLDLQEGGAQPQKPAGRLQGILGTGTGQGQQPNRAMESDTHGTGITKPQAAIPHHGHTALRHGLGQGHGHPAVRRQQLIPADAQPVQQGRGIQLQGGQQVVKQHHIDTRYSCIPPRAARTHHLLALRDKTINCMTPHSSCH